MSLLNILFALNACIILWFSEILSRSCRVPFFINPFSFNCFSSLDTDTEERLIKNLKNNFKNKSVIIVSHRVSCVKHADKIIVIEKGKIIQEGTHKNLIKIDGYYKELYNKQNREIT